MSNIHAVTGAFGYSGKYIARRLLDAGHQVLTLTNSPGRENPFGDRIRVSPFNFDRPGQLSASLEGVSVLYNTYWIRFNHPRFTHSEAGRNTRILFEAAQAAGVARVVHISITNPSIASDLEYFRGKAELESALVETGMSCAVARPTVLFGKEDILINNIAWFLRRFSVFGVLEVEPSSSSPYMWMIWPGLPSTRGAGRKIVSSTQSVLRRSLKAAG